MKKVILSLFVLALSCSASFAQEAAKAVPTTATQATVAKGKTMADFNAEGKAETDKMDKVLGLSADQKAKLNTMNTKLAIVHERTTHNGNDAALQHYLDSKDQMYQSVLTADQYKKYKEMTPTPAK